VKLLAFIRLQVIKPEQLTDSKSNFRLRPILQAVLFDLFEGRGSMLDNPCNELFIFLLAPVVALLDIEVLKIE
jgi:hypothetical protein